MTIFNRCIKFNGTSAHMFLVLSFALLLMSCDNDDDKDDNVGNNNTPKPHIPELTSTHVQEEDNNDNLLNNIHSSVKKHQNTCPKLLKRQVDTPVISRNNEFLHGKYCDYYIYPEANQQLSVDTHGAHVKVSLIMPVSQILDDNPYTISETRRHVIRVEYNGMQKISDNFSYNITVNLENS